MTTTKSRTGVPDDIRTQEYAYDGKGNLLTKTEDPNTSFAVSTIIVITINMEIRA